MFGRGGKHESPEAYFLARTANEVLADRYAWSRLYPGEPVPVMLGREKKVTAVEELLTTYGRYFQLDPREVKPLPAGEREYVPKAHVDHGIPWADGRRPMFD